MAEVQLKNIKKVYPYVSGEEKKKNKKKSADEPEKKKVNLHKDKEFIVLVGPSGCGKSTTLRMVAGLEEISGGELYIDGKLMNDVAPKDRDIAMVFQNYALYPHMTVYDNMAFSLKLRHTPKDEIDRKVREAAEILDITQYLERKPKALSGGQRQRVAIGRAIVRAPKVMLMDEPLSNLDAKLRNEMRAEIIKLRQRINTTFMYVTHDQTEAMTLGDRIVIMKDGYIQGDKFFVEVGGIKVELSEDKEARLLKNDVQSQPITLGVRPEHTDVAEQGIASTVEVAEMMGSSVHLHLNADGKDVIVIVPTIDMKGSYKQGDTVHFTFDGKVAHVFSKETDKNLEF